MNQETQDKIESIIISQVNTLYEKATARGLDIDDMRCLEILCKIKKETASTSTKPLAANIDVPDNLMELLRAVKGAPPDKLE